MTYFYYNTRTWNTGAQESQPQIPEETKNMWKHVAKKSNWRVVELPNGYFQTECKDLDTEVWKDVTRRETIEGAERAIDSSIDHYKKKLKAFEGPKVVKTFKDGK
jgi:hypothetical protein|tara:strand:+ start:166 stop:480 length:315 start_codon:yes stop_codon:yes gene_type:complete